MLKVQIETQLSLLYIFWYQLRPLGSNYVYCSQVSAVPVCLVKTSAATGKLRIW